jgi:hypothetical protein
MERNPIPESWEGQRVRVEIRDARDPISGSVGQFDSNTGWLVQVNDQGIAIDMQGTFRFYPWSAVREVILLPA